MNKTAVPLLCLITGGVLGVCGGYQWRAQMDHATAHVASDASEPQTGTEAKAGSKSELAANISSGVAASAPVASLESELDDFLANYGPRRLDALLAMEWGEDQLHAGLVKLSSKRRGTNHKLELKAALYRLWAKRDASGAWQAALVDPDSANSGTLLGGVAREMATKEPMSAADLALKLGMGARRGDVLADVFDEWGKHDVAAAVAWWNAHPNMPGDTDVIDAALKHAAGTQPELAAQQALKVRGVEGRRSALWTVVGAWAQTDFDAAFQWVQTIPDAETRKTHLVQAMGVLASSDPQAAGDWLSAFVNTRDRSDGRHGVGGHTFHPGNQGRCHDGHRGAMAAQRSRCSSTLDGGAGLVERSGKDGHAQKRSFPLWNDWIWCTLAETLTARSPSRGLLKSSCGQARPVYIARPCESA